MLTEEQSLNAILHLEGMPAELPLLVDSPDYSEIKDEANEEHELSAHDQVTAALNLDQATPVDVFISAQAEHEYRWKADEESPVGAV